MKINCRTLFDCTYTGVTGSYRPAQLPFTDRAGQSITNQAQWERSINQQRNYETLLQIFGLRTQPMNVTEPHCVDNVWHFSFESETEAVFLLPGQDDLAALRADCEGVPMTLNLDEKIHTVSRLCTQGPQQNIWFSL
jgi:hypothetical protein